jgi:hypothetical protein
VSIFLVRFGAFLGKGSSKTRGNNSVRFQKKHRGNIVFVFFCVDFFYFFSFGLFLLRWLSASRQGGPKNAITSFYGVVRLILFPCRFLYASKTIPAQIKHARTSAVFFLFFFCGPLPFAVPVPGAVRSGDAQRPPAHSPMHSPQRPAPGLVRAGEQEAQYLPLASAWVPGHLPGAGIWHCFIALLTLLFTWLYKSHRGHVLCLHLSGRMRRRVAHRLCCCC